AFAVVDSLPVEDRDRLSVESTLASMEASTGNPEVARQRFLRVLALQRKLCGNDSEDVQTSIDALSSVGIETARLDEARPLLEELLETRRAKYGAEHSRTFSAINGLAIIALEQ